MEKISKEDFEVFDFRNNRDGGYKYMGNGRWYNHEMYVDALKAAGLAEPNWFEKTPLHWRYFYFMTMGVIIGYLLGLII